MNNITSFKEYLRLSEAGLVQPGVDPAANAAIVNNVKSLATNPNNKGVDAGTLVNKAATKAVTQGQVTPGAAIKALNPPTPGQPQQKMMKKTMRKR